MDLTWTDFKQFVDNRNLPIQWVDIKSTYWMKSFDGAFEVSCILVKDGSTDCVDFETNYKALGNKSPHINSVQVLGKDALTLSPRAMEFTAPANQVSVWDKQLDAVLVLRGGILFSPNATLGDKIRVSIIDKDNVLGAGGTPTNPFVMGMYVKEWFVMPGITNELVDVSISQPLPQGVYIRFEYTSKSLTVSPDVVVNFVAYEFLT